MSSSSSNENPLLRITISPLITLKVDYPQAADNAVSTVRLRPAGEPVNR